MFLRREIKKHLIKNQQRKEIVMEAIDGYSKNLDDDDPHKKSILMLKDKYITETSINKNYKVTVISEENHKRKRSLNDDNQDATE